VIVIEPAATTVDPAQCTICRRIKENRQSLSIGEDPPHQVARPTSTNNINVVGARWSRTDDTPGGNC
jgi:hypothetical protein